MSLNEQIKKTEDIVERFHRMQPEIKQLSGNEEENLIFENQFAIMKTLREIQNDLRRVKKSYPLCGPG